MYKAIIFDFFDVIRSDPYKAWLKKHGIERTGEYQEVSKHLDRGHIDLDTFFENLNSLSGQPKESVAKEYETTELVDERVISLIPKLRQHYRIGLLSNAPSEYLRSILKQHNLETLFDEIVISSEVKLIKPAPEVFHYILKKLDSDPEYTIFIDDSEPNVLAAREQGITAIQFKDYERLEDDLKRLEIKLS